MYNLKELLVWLWIPVIFELCCLMLNETPFLSFTHSEDEEKTCVCCTKAHHAITNNLLV